MEANFGLLIRSEDGLKILADGWRESNRIFANKNRATEVVEEYIW